MLLVGCHTNQSESSKKDLVETFLQAYFSLELSPVMDTVDAESTSIELPEFYTTNFTENGQDQLVANRYTDSIHEIATQNDCQYTCDKVELEPVETTDTTENSTTTYHFTVTLSDQNNNTFQCKGDIQLVQENDSWLIDGFYPVFDSLLK